MKHAPPSPPKRLRLAALAVLAIGLTAVYLPEFKMFHVHDAAGLHYWHRAGGFSGFLSGRGGDAVERRARELSVHEVILRRVDKAAAFAELLARRGLSARDFAYVGDDMLDVPVLSQVAFAATVPEARVEALAASHYVTERSCGFGAVRDVIELLLKARGLWDGIVSRGGLP